MPTLTSDSQYIGRSNAVYSRNYLYSYYVLMYANIAETNQETGIHKVRVVMTLACDGAGSFYGYNTTASAKAGGVTAFEWVSQKIPNATWQTSPLTAGGVTYPGWIDIAEGYAELYIGYGVSQDITISASFLRDNITGEPPNYLPLTVPFEVSTIVTLPAINGASVPTLSASTVAMGSFVTIYTNRKSTGFTHTIEYSFGKDTGTIAEGVGDSVEWEPPVDLANQIGAATSGVGGIFCTTYSGETKIGEKQVVPITLTVPENSDTKPDVDMKLSPTDSTFGSELYVQNHSKVGAVIDATAKCSASIKSKQMVIGNSAYGDPYISSWLTQTGNVKVIGKATDSRGFVGTVEKTITVIPYAKPAIVPASGQTSVVCARCDVDGNFTDSGTYLRIIAKRKYSQVISNGTQYNFCSIRYRVGNGNWQPILAEEASSDEVDTTINGVVTDITKSYTIEIGVVDSTGSTSSVKAIVPTANVAFHLRKGGNGAAFGGFADTDNELTVASTWTLNVEGNMQICGKSFLDRTYPVNSIYLSFDQTSPAELFGGTWERIIHKFLWAAMETDELGGTGGEFTHTLTADEMPSHRHYYNSRCDGYPLAEYRTGGTRYFSPLNDSQSENSAYSNTGSTYTGGGGAHNNMPPYVQIAAWRRIA